MTENDVMVIQSEWQQINKQSTIYQEKTQAIFSASSALLGE